MNGDILIKMFLFEYFFIVFPLSFEYNDMTFAQNTFVWKLQVKSMVVSKKQ